MEQKKNLGSPSSSDSGTNSIKVRALSDHYLAYIDEAPSCVGAGSSELEAVGALVRDYPELFNIHQISYDTRHELTRFSVAFRSKDSIICQR